MDAASGNATEQNRRSQSDDPEPHKEKKAGLWRAVVLAYGSLGVIYGDVGTSPLYTYASTFHGTPSREDVLGVVSLIFYTMTLIVLIKYVCIVLRADDTGEGGTFALYSLICRAIGITPLGARLGDADKTLARFSNSLTHSSQDGDAQFMRNKRPMKSSRYSHKFNEALQSRLSNSTVGQMVLLVVVVLATAMVVGDGILTPAISVLSAVGGLQAAPGVRMSSGAVVGISAAILVALFVSQRYGSGVVGRAFAPVVIVWLALNAAVGIINLVTNGGSIFAALNPAEVVWFFHRNGGEGWKMLGGVMLCITGAEAMYADMGHFNRVSISLSFCCYVYPCLMLTYFGQGAFLLNNPELVEDVFWSSVPRPIFWPVFVAAILASVVASQALISGAFSIMRQATMLGLCPKLTIIHTGKHIEGQVYLPEINYLLMVLCIAVTVGFQSTAHLGEAYGVAVMSVMTITTLLAALVMCICWDIHPLLVTVFLLVYLPIELAYMTSTLVKIASGGWVAPLVALLVSIIKLTWWWGSSLKAAHTQRNKVPVHKLLNEPSIGGPEAAMSNRLSLQLEATRLSLQLERHSTTSAANANRPGSRITRCRFKPPTLNLVSTGEPVATISGMGLYYNDNSGGTPPIMMHVLQNMPATFQVMLFITVKIMPLPTVDRHERYLVRREFGFSSIFHVVVRYGYLDRVDHGQEFVEEITLTTVQHLLDRHGIGGPGAAEKLFDALPGANSTLDSWLRNVQLVAEGAHMAHPWVSAAMDTSGTQNSPARGLVSEEVNVGNVGGGPDSAAGAVVASVSLKNPRAAADLPVGKFAAVRDPRKLQTITSMRTVGDLEGALAAAADPGMTNTDGEVWFKPAVSNSRRGTREGAVPDSSSSSSNMLEKLGNAVAVAAAKGEGVVEEEGEVMWELTPSQLEALEVAAMVVRAYRAHWVHLLGRVNLKVTPSSNLVRRIMLGHLFQFLAANSRPATHAWSIPTRHLIELGMELEV